MKIAVCLSGQPRALPEGLEQLKRNLLEPNGIEDVFVHAWKSKVFDSAQPHQSGRWSYHPDTEALLASLNPKSLLIQENCPFDHLSHLQDLPTAIQKKLASMFYSVWRANELKREHEILYGDYDLVIKTRIDLNYHKPVILSELDIDLKSFNVPAIHQHMRVGDSYPIVSGGSYSSMSDTFVIGRSPKIDFLSLIGKNFELIYNDIWPYAYGEAFLGYQANLYQVPIHMVDVQYNLIK